MLRLSQGSIEDILEHFSKMEEDFVKNIERRILIYDYSEKLFKNASRIEFYDESNLVGLLAFYINKRESFITNCSIIPPYRKKKIGSRLMEKYEKLCKSKNISYTKLEVLMTNEHALRYYINCDFTVINHNELGSTFVMGKYHEA